MHPVHAASVLLQLLPVLQLAGAVPTSSRSDHGHGGKEDGDDPFAILDKQDWVNPDDMTWDDWRAPPGTNWADPSRKGSNRNFNIALVTVDYDDKKFVLTTPEGESTVFGNPQPGAPRLARDDVPSFYQDFLNNPDDDDLNGGHTLHEYWMGDSGGRYGVDLTAFGVYQLPALSYQYGVGADMNEGSCPEEKEADDDGDGDGKKCDLSLRDDALGAWRADVGDDKADSFELVFILSAGQDESSSWQEFGEMKFQTRDDVPDEFGPPAPINGSDDQNWGATRYVEWTSWAAAECIWPNAGNGSSTQSESSGMATFAHELSHLLDIPDNYNNPYGDPIGRSYTGPWSMLSRGSFNGPGGPHTRWQIPPRQGGSMGSLHTMRDKSQIGLVDSKNDILNVSREALPKSGPVVARLTARSVVPGEDELMGLQVIMDADKSPACNASTEPLCDGGGFNNYNLEVIDRMGADSFTPDAGVMISKTKDKAVQGEIYQWTIDANPQDIELVDFKRPNGTEVMITIGDYRQLSDALFHAGTRSGSEFEYVDKANRLHFYIIDVQRDEDGVLSYTTAVRSLDGGGEQDRKVELDDGKVSSNSPTKVGVTCSFELHNADSDSSNAGNHPQDVSAHSKSDIYRLEADVKGHGWEVALPNALATAEAGKSVTVTVAVRADEAKCSQKGVVKLTATSESDPSVKAKAQCLVDKEK